MNTLKIKRHWIQFYLTLVIVSIFCISFGVLMLMWFFNDLPAINYKAILFLIVLILFEVYAIASIVRGVPTIRIKGNRIFFGSKTYSFDDIEELHLHGKYPVKLFLSSRVLEGMYLKFKDGTRKYLHDDMYINLWELKRVLSTVKGSSEPPRINQIHETEEFLETYKGNVFANLLSVFFLLMLFTAIFILRVSQDVFTELIMGLCAVFMIPAITYNFHYIQVCSSYIIIKNHYRFWIHKHYDISDIKELVIETTSVQSPYCVRVITYDYKSKSYPASTLTTKKWLTLIEHFKRLGVPVRNESF